MAEFIDFGSYKTKRTPEKKEIKIKPKKESISKKDIENLIDKRINEIMLELKTKDNDISTLKLYFDLLYNSIYKMSKNSNRQVFLDKMKIIFDKYGGKRIAEES